MKIRFPDESVKEFDNGSTGRDIAMSISEGLLRSSAAINVNGTLMDLSAPITMDAKISIITFKEQD